MYFIILMVFYWAILIPIFTADNDSDVKKLDSQEWQQAVEEGAFVLDSEQEENHPVVEDENQRIPGPLPGPRGSSSKPHRRRVPPPQFLKRNQPSLSSRTRTRPSPGC